MTRSAHATKPIEETAIAPSPLERFLPVDEVMKITGWSKQTLWREAKAGRFPNSIPTSPNRVAWLESEVLAWQEQRIKHRNNPEWKRRGGGRPPKASPTGKARSKPWPA